MDKEMLKRLVVAIRADLEQYLKAPHEYTAEYFESVLMAAQAAEEILIGEAK